MFRKGFYRGSTVVPQGFYRGSTVVPQGFYRGSTVVPQGFYRGSTVVPQGFVLTQNTRTECPSLTTDRHRSSHQKSSPVLSLLPPPSPQTPAPFFHFCLNQRRCRNWNHSLEARRWSLPGRKELRPGEQTSAQREQVSINKNTRALPLRAYRFHLERVTRR